MHAQQGWSALVFLLFMVTLMLVILYSLPSVNEIEHKLVSSPLPSLHRVLEVYTVVFLLPPHLLTHAKFESAGEKIRLPSKVTGRL